MNKEDIFHLGSLARIKLTDEEADALKTDISGILEYVSTINKIVADTSITKEVGARYNVFREDSVTNDPESFTEALLNEMPEKKDRYLKVKKILNPDN